MSTHRIADVVFVGATVILLTLVAVRFVGSSSTSEVDDDPPAKEGLVTEARGLPGIPQEPGKPTVVVYLSSTCRYCALSASFYKELLEGSEASSGYRVVFAFLRKDDGAAGFLEKHGLRATPAAVERFPEGARGTPTLVLCGDDGTLLASWTGKLNKRQRAQLQSRVSSP